MSLIEQIKDALNDMDKCKHFITKLNSEPKLLSKVEDQESLINKKTLLVMLRHSPLSKTMLNDFCSALRTNIQSLTDYKKRNTLQSINKLINTFTKHKKGVINFVAPLSLNDIGYSKDFLDKCENQSYMPKLCNIHDKLQDQYKASNNIKKTTKILQPVETHYAPLLEWTIRYYHQNYNKEELSSKSWNIKYIADIIGLKEEPYSTDTSIIDLHLNWLKEEPALFKQFNKMVKGKHGFLNLFAYILKYDYLTTFNYTPKTLLEIVNRDNGFDALIHIEKVLNEALNLFNKEQIAELIQFTQSNHELYTLLEIHSSMIELGFTNEEMINIAQQKEGKVFLELIKANLPIFTRWTLSSEQILYLVTSPDFAEQIKPLKLEKSSINILKFKEVLNSKIKQKKELTCKTINNSPLLNYYKKEELDRLLQFKEGDITLAKLEENLGFINFFQFNKTQLLEQISQDYGYNVFASLKLTIQLLNNSGLNNDQIAVINFHQIQLNALQTILKMSRYFPELRFTFDEFIKLVIRADAPMFMEKIIVNINALIDLNIEPKQIIDLIDTYHYSSFDLFEALTLHHSFFKSQNLNPESIIELLKQPNREMIIAEMNTPKSPQIKYNPNFFNPYPQPVEEMQDIQNCYPYY
ncbi:MAG TPA: hypothetical protein PK657_07480 [Legionella sp.]|nr:hypothetical protein [Legionella sp.]